MSSRLSEPQTRIVGWRLVECAVGWSWTSPSPDVDCAARVIILRHSNGRNDSEVECRNHAISHPIRNVLIWQFVPWLVPLSC